MHKLEKWILGLTGGISSGKTTVCNFLKNYGCSIVDADICARDVVAPGTPGLKKIQEHFGNDIVDQNGFLDRKQLRNIIFQNEHELQFINSLMQPLIKEKIRNDIEHSQGCYTVLAAPLLFESNLDNIPDRILCMDIDKQTQIERTMQRDGCSYKVAQSMVEHQWPREKKTAMSHDVLVSNFPSLNELEKAVFLLHQKYMDIIKNCN